MYKRHESRGTAPDATITQQIGSKRLRTDEGVIDRKATGNKVATKRHQDGTNPTRDVLKPARDVFGIDAVSVGHAPITPSHASGLRQLRPRYKLRLIQHEANPESLDRKTSAAMR